MKKVNKIILPHDEIMREVKRKYGEGVSTICISDDNISDDGTVNAYVVVQPSKNWSHPETRKLLDISDTCGGGGYVSGLLCGKEIQGVPYCNQDVIAFCDSLQGEEARKRYKELKAYNAGKEEWEEFIRKYQEEFFLSEDLEGDLRSIIEDDLRNIEGFEDVDIEWE